MNVKLPAGTLECPHCGGDNLHHQEVTVYDRDEEDSDGTVTVVGNKTVESKRVSASELLGRRTALRIRFVCENDDRDHPELLLEIRQHKGYTYVDWVTEE